MSKPALITVANWRTGLPSLTGRMVSLREASRADAAALSDLLSLADGSRFGVDPVTGDAVTEFVDRLTAEREAGVGFAFVITLGASGEVAGLVHLRQLDPMFEAAECDCVVALPSRGTGVFVEAAGLVASFAFGTVGVHRIESRVPAHNGRANGALRKLGAVQEGILRRAARRADGYVDQILWSILKDDWGEHRVPTGTRIH